MIAEIYDAEGTLLRKCEGTPAQIEVNVPEGGSYVDVTPETTNDEA